MENQEFDVNEWWIVRIDETDHWSKEWLNSLKVTKLWGVYLYKPTDVYVYCSYEPKMYFLHALINPCFELEEGEDYEKVWEEIYNQRIKYIDELSDHFRKDFVDSQVNRRKFGIFETFDEALEAYTANPVW